MKANYQIVGIACDHVLIEDLGPWDKHLSVTNDAERVVEDLAMFLAGRRLYYIDSQGDTDELLVKDGRFAGFKSIREKL